jgi:hypothetical protein
MTEGYIVIRRQTKSVPRKNILAWYGKKPYSNFKLPKSIDNWYVSEEFHPILTKMLLIPKLFQASWRDE